MLKYEAEKVLTEKHGWNLKDCTILDVIPTLSSHIVYLHTKDNRVVEIILDHVNQIAAYAEATEKEPPLLCDRCGMYAPYPLPF